MSTAHIPQTLLHPDTVSLGRLTTNANRPHYNFHDPLAPRPDASEKRIVQHTSLSETRRFSKSSSNNFNLGDLISFGKKNSSTSTATLTAPNATTYDLSNNETWFRDACKNPATREWLQNAIERRKNVYLIVGYRTASGASLKSHGSGKSSSDGGGSLPVRAFAPPGALNMAFPNPAGSGRQSEDSVRKLQFEAVGEQVFAVLYRKVKFSWLSSRKVDNMNLEEGNRWKSVWEWRGATGPSPEAEEDDILEAELTDVSDFEDCLEDEREGDEEDEDDDDDDEEEEVEVEEVEKEEEVVEVEEKKKEKRDGSKKEDKSEVVQTSGSVHPSPDPALGPLSHEVWNTRWPSTGVLLGLLLIPLLAFLIQSLYTSGAFTAWIHGVELSQ
ncbi:uncharacterized protein LAJ45_10333 [Morchella importuna]|uniref:uncharacterized protein n=1 Tax=Morchella importuna TaxID=1174673 RepID=UPI001E8E49DA|nr:uncharacterized protein LAJ45_10333 [Morchella importuna]KAH8145693.1 hypothetical protein LAJ45_10333 [Morchella importuna]